ncbi:HAD hydrolase family protein [Denitrobaculum tricleocarpae]|uniref:HAD hydrolase family protein n=1 Tax=Denitrobaculum tricleocarpae TaxID=2591009 RepID=UPI0015D31C1C|nr:HAD hydrolase family protein [Denitrobaculum tricleocarpae]
MKLFVSDLDFTLLGADGTLSSRATRRLNDLIADGLIFTVATARSAPSIRHLLSGVALELPVIELNGAILRDLQSGHILEHYGLGMAAARSINDCFAEQGFAPYVSGLIGDQNPLFVPPLQNTGMQWFYDEKVHYGDPRLKDAPEDPIAANPDMEDVFCFVYLGTKTEIDQIASTVADRIPDVLIVTYANHYAGGWEIVIAAPRANKGHAVQRLLSHLREERAVNIRETTAFGDSSNDLEMLMAADNAVAVANATAAVKAEASAVIGHHKDDAVLDYLEKIHCGR